MRNVAKRMWPETPNQKLGHKTMSAWYTKILLLKYVKLSKFLIMYCVSFLNKWSPINKKVYIITVYQLIHVLYY